MTSFSGIVPFLVLQKIADENSCWNVKWGIHFRAQLLFFTYTIRYPTESSHILHVVIILFPRISHSFPSVTPLATIMDYRDQHVKWPLMQNFEYLRTCYTYSVPIITIQKMGYGTKWTRYSCLAYKTTRFSKFWWEIFFEHFWVAKEE